MSVVPTMMSASSALALLSVAPGVLVSSSVVPAAQPAKTIAHDAARAARLKALFLKVLKSFPSLIVSRSRSLVYPTTDLDYYLIPVC